MIFRHVTGAGTSSSAANSAAYSAHPCKSGFKGVVVAAAVSLASLASTTHAAGDAAAGEAKAYTCLGCHGVKHYVNSYPTYHVPRIAGQKEAYLVSALQAYRAKTRSHQTMQANAGLLSDQDIEDIAAWFAAQGASN